MSNVSNLEFSLLEHIITGAFLLFIVGVVLWAVAKSLHRKSMGKMRTIEAVVLAKSVDNYTSQPIFIQDKQVNTGFVEKGLLYMVLFRTSEGKEISFDVSKKFYEQLSEGQSGKVTYKGFRLIQFGNLQNTPATNGTDFKGLREEL
ncbi:MAG: DUF2500 family protein [Lachnospiraceae bacterium]|nr:DUF2500 family protein [Lachnospiraceae bacterium]